ncbi:MAG: thymidine phosphorylase [Firmicutes bacterium]|nr:thymidine phosphorylase [Bacillota bacterium]
MNIVDIINKKRLGYKLTKEEIAFAINNYIDKKIEDYQMSALLMAICLNGMDSEETFNMTDVFLHSGDILDLSEINTTKVDKHSTGGIGDKTTLVLAPLVASCGVPVAKMSGRSLGFTGGTIDKLEAIPNLRTDLTLEEFINQVKEIGVAVVSQTGNLVPADKKIYALRDVTGTVQSLPLIASSIMSKKLASGVDKIVIDLKIGDGAFVKTVEEAKILGNIMVEIGKNYNKEVICVVTSMDQPLGKAIGNSLEVIEAMDTLKCEGPKDLEEVVLTLGSYMVSMGKNISYQDAQKELMENLKNGKAYSKFEEMVKMQKGNIEALEISSKVYSLKSKTTGFIKEIKAQKLGELVRSIGGGRYTKEDVVDFKVGMVLNKKVNDYVLEDEELVKVYLGDKDININEILDCFVIDMEQKEDNQLIYGVIK